MRGVGAPFGVGETVAGTGDIDGDGVADFVAGTHNGGPGGGGIVMAFSGSTGAELYRWKSNSRFGEAVDAGIDLDQDGVGDVLVGAPRELLPGGTRRPGAVFGYAGRDGSQLFRVDTNAPVGTTDFGWSVVVLGQQPGSPFPVFAVNEPGYGWRPPSVGAVAAAAGPMLEEMRPRGESRSTGCPRPGFRAIAVAAG